MLTLHPLFGNDAVLQCEEPLPIWGMAEPGAPIAVRLGDLAAATAADSSGVWRVSLSAQPPGGPHELTVTSDKESLKHTGIMLGEVWLCSGQSNMEWTLGMLQKSDLDTASANDPLLRCFTVQRAHSLSPLATLQGIWRATDPATVRDFSATGYGFALHLRAATGRAVGLIVAAFGGTQISAWLPTTTREARPEYTSLREEWAKKAALPTPVRLEPHPYLARSSAVAGWETSAFDDRGWSTLKVPGFWQDQGWNFNGAVWYRRTVELPAHWRGCALVVDFGACDDFDETFVNGTKVGGIGPELPTAYNTLRAYPVPAPLTRNGRVTIAVRVFDQWGNGGIVRRAGLLLENDAGERLPLEGTWQAKVETELPFRLPPAAGNCPPTSLYNGMIHPIAGFGLRGVLWYQGESDAPRAAQYPLLLADFIAAWRAAWGRPDLPFGIVQIANHLTPQPRPGDSAWAELRWAQLAVAQATPHTGLVVAIDLGEPDNLHPPRKGAVGERLARWALATVYRRPMEAWGSPLPIKSWPESDAICVRFEQVGAGLRTRDDAPPRGFQIAGVDRQWRWAEAAIVALDTVHVRANGVASPAAVRYAWQDNPECSLENSSGLPASPFRTDDWPLTTAS